MTEHAIITMRDALIERICERMQHDSKIFFLTADLGAPALDRLRDRFPNRFVNVGIAEQNLVNVAAGLALEGFTVYAYAIASFITMRAYEQIRINLALTGQNRPLNVNLIGVGCGVSYDLSGPTHHCLEDLSIMRTLPNIMLLSPSDPTMAAAFADVSIDVGKPKYIRLDGKPSPRLYDSQASFDWNRGFTELVPGENICIVSTGAMTRKALETAKRFVHDMQIGVVDLFVLNPVDIRTLASVLAKYARIITIEEGFKNRGGLDCLVQECLRTNRISSDVINLGFDNRYLFEAGTRESLYARCGFADRDIAAIVNQLTPHLATK